MWTDTEIRAIHKTVVQELDERFGNLVRVNGEPGFSILQSVVYPWTFILDLMHLKDENYMRLKLALWTGAFGQQEYKRAMKDITKELEETQLTAGEAAT